MPVASLMAVTLAPGITAPLVSRTVPVISDVDIWPSADTAAKKKAINECFIWNPLTQVAITTGLAQLDANWTNGLLAVYRAACGGEQMGGEAAPGRASAAAVAIGRRSLASAADCIRDLVVCQGFPDNVCHRTALLACFTKPIFRLNSLPTSYRDSLTAT